MMFDSGVDVLQVSKLVEELTEELVVEYEEAEQEPIDPSLLGLSLHRSLKSCGTDINSFIRFLSQPFNRQMTTHVIR